ncbi:hypothetical protein Droror1_Dr00025080 [Drosera rotundifolia]
MSQDGSPQIETQDVTPPEPRRDPPPLSPVTPPLFLERRRLSAAAPPPGEESNRSAATRKGEPVRRAGGEDSPDFVHNGCDQQQCSVLVHLTGCSIEKPLGFKYGQSAQQLAQQGNIVATPSSD